MATPIYITSCGINHILLFKKGRKKEEINDALVPNEKWH